MEFFKYGEPTPPLMEFRDRLHRDFIKFLNVNQVTDAMTLRAINQFLGEVLNEEVLARIERETNNRKRAERREALTKNPLENGQG